jgi:thymidylate synthase (FAD)
VANKIELLDKGFIELIDHMGNDHAITEAARVSFLGESKGDEKDAQLIDYLMKHKHMTPFESVVLKFRVKAPICIRSQWFRSRTWSFSEISRRFTAKDIEFYIPEKWRLQDTTNTQASKGYLSDKESASWSRVTKHHAEMSLKLYNDMRDEGISREMARMVLPQNLYTMFYGTVNLRNLFHFLELRNDSHAQPEIQVYAEAIEKLIEPIVPVSFKAWKKYGIG